MAQRMQEACDRLAAHGDTGMQQQNRLGRIVAKLVEQRAGVIGSELDHADRRNGVCRPDRNGRSIDDHHAMNLGRQRRESRLQSQPRRMVDDRAQATRRLERRRLRRQQVATREAHHVASD